jgi:dTDP-4-amino-4,6-dideoxygalactose transaminase
VIEELGRGIRHQVSNLVRVVTGMPVAPTPMGSMTLDLDDVTIARQCLADPESWADEDAVTQFESDFASYCGVHEAVSFKSGRVALSAVLDTLGIGAGDEVIVPGYTCVVVPNAIEFTGAIPVFCDIELDTYGADASSLRALITDNTRAIIIQHLYGLVCRDYLALIELATQHGILVIEDCAHATGARFRGLSVGLRGDAGFFSCEQSKVINSTCGGVAISRRPDINRKLRQYQHESPWPEAAEVRSALKTIELNYFRFKHAQRWWRGDIARLRLGKKPFVATGHKEVLGEMPDEYRARMSSAIARVARNQLGKIEVYNSKRRENAHGWDTWCDQHGYSKPLVIDDSLPVFLRYPILAEESWKKKPIRMMRQFGIWPGVWFSTHLHPSARRVQGCPNADIAVRKCINLPCILDND